jgi:hypothetical protein
MDLPGEDVEVVVRAAAHVEQRLRTRADSGELRVALDAAPSGTLVGRVLGPRRGPVAGARVRVVPGDVETRTEKDGSFELEGVPTDTPQRVMVEAQGLRVRESARADRLLVTVAADERQRIEIQMEPAEDDAPADAEAETAIRVVTGRLVRGNGAPVAAATVAWAGLAAVTGPDGRFRLERPERDARAALPRLAITPPAGLLEPEIVALRDRDGDGTASLDDVGLRARPTSRLVLSQAPNLVAGALSFAVLVDTHDHLIGQETEPFQVRRAVTYDGAWLHVGRPGSWRRGGHRVAWVGVSTPTGPAAAAMTWPAAAGLTQVARPSWQDTVAKVEIPIPKKYRRGTLRLRLTDPPEGAPIVRLGLPTEFEVRVERSRLQLAHLSRGFWIADLHAPPASGLPTLRTTIRDGRARGFRPAR